MNAFSHRMLDYLIEINAVLTPEQRSELKQKFPKAHGKMR
jgi:Spy/CpxP family protein refolding chaperone